MNNKKYNPELIKETEKFIESGNKMVELWEDTLNSDYPFDKSFDEIMYDVMNWLEYIGHNQ